MKIIELAFPGDVERTRLSGGKVMAIADGANVSVYLRVKHLFGWSPWDVVRHAEEITVIRSEEQYRHLGTSLGWAVVGGVLTGGLGALAGAAWGGRRKGDTFYAIEFSGGTNALVSTSKKSEINLLNHAAENGSTKKLKLLDMAAAEQEEKYQLAARKKGVVPLPA